MSIGSFVLFEYFFTIIAGTQLLFRYNFTVDLLCFLRSIYFPITSFVIQKKALEQKFVFSIVVLFTFGCFLGF